MSGGLNLIAAGRMAARRRAVVIRRWLEAGSVFVLAVVAVGVVGHARWADDPGALAAELEALRARGATAEGQVRRLNDEMAAVERRVAANRAMTSQPDYAVLLAVMAGTLDERVMLRSCGFEPLPLDELAGGAARTVAGSVVRKAADGFELKAAGYARSQADAAGYVLRLEKTGLFRRVRLLSTRREPVPFGSGSAIAFEIRCAIAPVEGDAGPGGGA